MIKYTLLDKFDKSVYDADMPEGSLASFTVVPGGLWVHDLLADVRERGKVRFTVVKDMSEFKDMPQTKAAERVYTFDEIAYVTVSVRTGNSTTVFENLPADFDIHFRDTDDVEDGYQTSTCACDTLLSLPAGEYKVVSYSVFDDGKKLLETNTKVNSPVFVVEDNKTTDADVPVKLHESDEYIKDYYALYEIWKSLNGEQWYYIGEDHPRGCNWEGS